MSALFDSAKSVEVPKVVLHDHLDGGLRPTTIVELADEIGWTPRLPSTDPGELHRWFVRGAETKDLLQYLATFEHTGAVMQRADDLVRIAREAALDLAADGVVYAEVRLLPSCTCIRASPSMPSWRRCRKDSGPVWRKLQPSDEPLS